MTAQQIENEIKSLLNNDNEETRLMYTEIVDENLNSTFYTFSGLLEDVFEAIEETHEENDYSEFNTLTKTELINIYYQVK